MKMIVNQRYPRVFVYFLIRCTITINYSQFTIHNLLSDFIFYFQQKKFIIGTPYLKGLITVLRNLLLSYSF